MTTTARVVVEAAGRVPDNPTNIRKAAGNPVARIQINLASGIALMTAILAPSPGNRSPEVAMTIRNPPIERVETRQMTTPVGKTI